jgi:hypothetical protein
VSLDLLNDRPALIGLLVQNDRLESEAFKEPCDSFAGSVVESVDNEEIG